jgi:ferredoxin
MKVKIDHAKCKSHFVCNLIAPSIFAVDSASEYPLVPSTDLDPTLEEDANRAALSCPEHAIVTE